MLYQNHSNHIEGVIKFNLLHHKKRVDFPESMLLEVNRVRKELIDRKLMGVDHNGFGYGNISFRSETKKEFVITGSQTGHLRKLTNKDFALVTAFSIAENKIVCYGETKASSESLSHAVFYQFSPLINSVIHIHDERLWRDNLNLLPATSPEAEYGTSGLAKSVFQLLKDHHPSGARIFVLTGHFPGLMICGQCLEETIMAILELYES